jgi:hypothetical protein
MSEREDQTRQGFEQDEDDELTDSAGVGGDKDTTPTEKPDSPGGASGEGTQSTGNPDAAG